MIDNSTIYSNYFELIDSGNQKFKYGLVWYLVYELVDPDVRFGFGSDYHYIDLLELSENEIKNKLEPIIDEAIINSLTCFKSRERHGLIYDLLDELHKLQFFPIFENKTKLIGMTDWLSEFMYHVLTQPENFKHLKTLMEIVSHSANRVIRNFHAAKLVASTEETKKHCLEYISLYYKHHGLRVRVDW